MRKEKSTDYCLTESVLMCKHKHCRLCKLLPLCVKYDTTPVILARYIKEMKGIIH